MLQFFRWILLSLYIHIWILSRRVIFRSFNVVMQAPSTDIAVSELTHASAEVSEIVFFLLGAMTIVEIVDAHQGFKLVTDNITTRRPRTLLWVVSALLCLAIIATLPLALSSHFKNCSILNLFHFPLINKLLVVTC